MPRFALLIDYDGTPFNGWQRQAAGQPSVQAAIEAALARLDAGDFGYCARCDEPIGDKRLQLDPATPFCVDCAGRGD